MLRCADAATSNHSHPLRSDEAPSRRITPHRSNAALRHVSDILTPSPSRPSPLPPSRCLPPLHTSRSHLR
eukprot:4844431-Prymnesium_polylepis.1